jgi:succinoglycan biosynthesis protein ExoA
MLPFVSVIIPVRNDRAMLPRLLDQLLAQNYPPDRYEILVVDGGSTDGTPDLIRRRFSARPTLVRGLRAARGEIILFLEGRCAVPSRNLIEDSVALLQHTGVDCLCRSQPLLAPAATDTGEIIAQACSSWLVRDPLDSGFVPAGSTDPVRGAAVYRREVFERVGLYDESFDVCEDLDLNTRVRHAGIRAFADPRLAVHHQPRAHVRLLFQDMLRRGRARLRLMSRHRASFPAAWLAPLVLLLLLPAVAFAWWLLPTLAAVILTIPLAVFAFAVVLASLQLGIRFGAACAWRAPCIFSAIWFGLGLGLVLELLRPAPTHGPLECLAPRQDREELEFAASRRAA